MSLHTIKSFLADLLVVNVKWHNVHWNVVGSNFLAVHKFTEELYEFAFEKFDEVAELLKMNGEFPVSSVKEILSLSEIKELDAKELNCSEALKIVHEDLVLLKEKALKIREEAESSKKYDVVMKFDELISELSKYVWFIESMLK
ncbi:Dps family protein [Fervidobacterium thailandense]|uniref:Ferritin/DPS domain-containing protein n=1 Tax=Fervidobacterium thailandense TaxID=1008305 RepID=A0A1E3G1D5_9BACT|nr:DNA starvation/stationary phase protection protein [Fervidobacterium thailandense]ODN30057.1 hypothetical protein A4H02_07720 [Fervidobacterium thailandense]